MTSVHAAKERCKRESYRRFKNTMDQIGDKFHEAANHVNSEMSKFFSKTGQWFKNTFG